MKKLFRALGLILGVCVPILASPSQPPAGNYIQNVSTNALNQVFNVSSGTIGNITITGTCTGSGCGSGGGGGSTGGSIIASTQNNVGYYSAVATNTINGSSNFTWNGSSVTIPALTVTSSATVNKQLNVPSTINFPSLNTITLSNHTINIGESVGGTGQDQVCEGVGACSTNAGISNIGIGFSANSGNVGVQNIAIGDSAMQSGITSAGTTENVAIGHNAAITPPAGFEQNVAIGNNAMGSSAINSSNYGEGVAVGASALASLTFGTENTAVGMGSLQSLLNGVNNVAVGHYALANSTSGNANVAIGAEAGSSDLGFPGNPDWSALHVSQSIFIGVDSGVTSTTTIMSDAVAIGYNSRVSASNVVQLGAQNNSDSVTLRVSSAAIDGNTTTKTLTVSSATALNGNLIISSTVIDGSGAAGTSGQALVSNGAGSKPTWQTVSGSGNAVLSSTQVWTGGNTFQSSTTFNGNINASSGVLLSGSAGTSGQVFTSGGAGTIPSWTTVSGGGNSLSSTQTWTGQNNWTTPAQSTFTYGLTVGSMTVNSSGNGNIELTISASTYSVTASSTISSNTAGHLAVWSGTNGTLIDGGVPGTGGGGGSGSGTITVTPQYQVPFMAIASSNVITSSANFTNNGTTITMVGIQTISETNVASQTATGILFNYATSSMTISSFSVSSLSSGNCVQAGAGGLLTTTGSSCGSGGGGVSLSSTNTWTAAQTFVSSVTVSTMTTISTSAGAQGSLGGILNLTSTNSAWNEPSLYINATANTGNNNSDILVDDGFTPAITWRETSQTNPSAEKWQISAHNGVMRFENRANTDSGFLPFMQVSSQTFWNDIYLGPTYGNQSNFSQLGMQVSTGNVYALTITTMTANVAPYLMSVSTNGVMATNGHIFNLPPGVINTTTTIPNIVTVVEASAPANTAWITLTLPSAASNPGLDIMIYKVDGSSDAIRIQGAGSDLIESTGTIYLNAKFQHASLHSLGTAGWGSGPGGIQYTPLRLYPTPYILHNIFSVASSSDEVLCPIYIPVPVQITGYVYSGDSASGNISLGLIDIAGNVVTSASPLPVAGGRQVVTQTPANISPGSYFLAVQFSNQPANMDGGDNNSGAGIQGCADYSGSTGGIFAVNIASPSGQFGSSSSPGVSILVSGGRQNF